MRARALRLAVVVAAVAAVAAGGGIGSAAAATATVPASADTYVDGSYPNTNFGTRNDVEVGGVPEQRGYVRFNLSNVSGTITRAVLVLGPESSSDHGFDVYGTSSSWGELTTTYANAPPVGAFVATSGPTTAYTTVSIDVTPYVVATRPSVSFAIVRLRLTEVEIESRDGGTTSLVPRLVVTTQATPAPPPAPTITSHPASLSNSATATFAFSDSDTTATFLCKLDAGSFTPCVSPTTYTGLADGSHTFSVEATNAAGTSAATSFTWTVDTTAPPAPTITGHPSDPSTSTSATFTFTDSESGVTFLCSLDGAAATACTSPQTYGNLSTGPHAFSVTARDAAGNSSPSTSFSWTVAPADTTPPPVPTITGGPENPTGSTSATFTFSDAESGVTFNCSLDAGTPQTCSSGVTYTGLGLGNHTFSVTASDAAGNTSAPATYSWSIQTEFVPNGNFENGVTGWSSFNGFVSPTTGGVVGPGAAHVTLNAGASGQFTIFPSAGTNGGGGKPPVSSTQAGYVYTFSGWIKAPAGRQVCMHIRERNAANVIVNEQTVCSTATGSYQRLGPTRYTPVAAGDSLTIFLAVENGVSGDSFDADGISILGGPAPPPSNDPVIAAAGDVACAPTDPDYNGGLGNPTTHRCFQQATGDLIRSINPTAVLALGDIQYECGELANYPSYTAAWGSFKGITHPTIGNHDYGLSESSNCTPNNGEGYYTYWGPQGAGVTGESYYSFDIGAWHIIALNSECSKVAGGCGAGSPEETWLRNDLATHPSLCTLAFWHEPSFSAGRTGRDHDFDAWWIDLSNAHAEIVLSGHDHTYQRWGRIDVNGNLNPSDPRQVVVGTGGEELFSSTPIAFNGSLTTSNNNTFGVLKLTLHPSSYDAQFIPASAPGNGTYTDSFSTACTP